eukprot:CAMPEP_0172732910 /NCGR_PEP_ID=MMETSP1074-20121228/105703_1 /TAXON_ID=2916 /ORGANISM="Ceratium fusus, Strain PA161109" /LENGTH=107 /DNA_ID=CAMNT_0013561315 /DNA_START=49 /DNA_END=369 /DNA_ORIENTATION=-
MTSAEPAREIPELQGAQDIEKKAPEVSDGDLGEEWDSTLYDITSITSWTAFFLVKGCAWDNVPLWRCMALNTCVSVSVMLATQLVPSEWLVSSDKFQKLGTFLNVFV